MSTVRLQEELSYEDAVKALGFEPGAIVSPHLPEFRKVEGKLCELIEKTRDEELRSKFREELARLNEAIRVVELGVDREPSARRRGGATRFLLSLVVVGSVIASAWWANTMVIAEKRKHVERKIEQLAVEGRIAVETRRWPEAEKVYHEILALDPESRRGRDGMRSIENGKEIELRQQTAYMLGTVRAAIEERGWDEAERVAKELLEIEPANAKAFEMLAKIDDGRVHDRIEALLERAEEVLRDEKWEELARRTKELEGIAPDHADLPRLRTMVEQGMRRLEENRNRARELYQIALARDTGSYSQEALDAMREAIRLSPEPEYHVLYSKLSSYARILQVPGEFATIGAALAAARARDKVRIGEGTFKEALRIEVEVDLEGAGVGKTIVEFDAREASALVVGEAAGGSRVASMTLRQAGMVLVEERFPVVAVDGGVLRLEDCVVSGGAGHGVAIINGGTGRLRNVQVEECGWDGLAVYGEASRAEVTDCRFVGNLQHGMDAWDGGAIEASKSRCSTNGLTGAVVMSPGVKSTLTQCVMDRNRELGILVAGGGMADLISNRAAENLLGGFLVEGLGTQIAMEGNVAEKNQRAGIVVDKLATVTKFRLNEAKQNAGTQLELKATIPEPFITPPRPITPPRAVEVPEEGTPKVPGGRR